MKTALRTIPWLILLLSFAVALKSLCQAFELILPTNFSDVFFYITLGVVVAGIASAAFKGRDFFSNLFRGRWEYSRPEKAILPALLIGYLGLAIVPIFIFG